MRTTRAPGQAVLARSGVAIRKNELYAIARRIIEKQLYLLRLGNDGNLVVHPMLRKYRLVSRAAKALQCHVIERSEDVWNLPFGFVGFGQVENIRVPGIEPISKALEWRAKPGAQSDDVYVEIPQPPQQGTGRTKVEMAQAKHRHGVRGLRSILVLT
jgi:hypothetical protein